MEIDEFIDTYSDDVIFLLEGRSALITHPLRSALSNLVDASTCRVLAVFMVGSIEMMLQAWRDRDRIGILNEYFAKGKSNGDRVSSLYEAFRQAGIQVDTHVFDDYLAIKYLRNTIVHGQWKKHEKDWLDICGFPTDTRLLTKDHLTRIEHVNHNVMLYITLTGRAQPNLPSHGKSIKLKRNLADSFDDTGILKLSDLDRIIWNNLERINNHIYAEVEKTVLTQQYDWTEERSRADLEALGHLECKRLFYLAARRAGEEHCESLAKHRVLAQEALEFWREYWRRAIAPSGLDEERIECALRVLGRLRSDQQVPIWPVIENVPDDVAYQLVDHVLANRETFTSNEVVDALRAGSLAYRLIPNIMPATLLTLHLPVADPSNAATYLREAERALCAFRLNRVWYSRVEHDHPSTHETLDFYDGMLEELRKHFEASVSRKPTTNPVSRSRTSCADI